MTCREVIIIIFYCIRILPFEGAQASSPFILNFYGPDQCSKSLSAFAGFKIISHRYSGFDPYIASGEKKCPFGKSYFH